MCSLTIRSAISAAEVPCPANVKCYRRIQDPNFVLYAGYETPEPRAVARFSPAARTQYGTVTENITVRLFSGEVFLNEGHYPIDAYCNKDRMDQLGLTEGEES
jgi:hypothetical protein